MENASKALIMAGSVLIALMIIGALVLMFTNLTNYQRTNTENARTEQIVAFNNEYISYNRKNVRGSELYSLLNKVIDYNRRESVEGTGWSDKGQTVSYEQMTINFTIDVSKLSADNTNRLFTRGKNTYTINRNENSFEKSIKNTIDSIEEKYGQDSLTNLTTAITSIYTDARNPSTQEQQECIEKFNSASKSVEVDTWQELQATKDDVYKYYEYIQFKRASFDCTDIKYNEKTGRVIQLDFKFNGKFN